MAEDLQSKATDIFRKVLTVGVGAIFLTEESLRTLVSEFKLPKELISGILDSAGKTKNEFLRNLSNEIIGRVSERMDPKALLDELLQNHEIDMHVKVSFTPKKKKDKHEG